MGSQYTSVPVTNYNANPPADDGSQTEANRLYWSTIKTKLTDMLKTAIESINTNIIAAFAKVDGGVVSYSTGTTLDSSVQGKLVRFTQSGVTHVTPDAAGVGSPFKFDYLNDSSGDVTFDGNGSQTIDGDASITVPAGRGGSIRTDGTNWFTSGQNNPITVIYPPKAQVSNLAIKVTGNTGLTVTADAITVTDGTTALMLTSVSHTINMATTGANALDAGSIASGTWYAIWEIAKADGTKAALASTSFSSPTMPTDYIHKARIGAVRTAAGSAQLLGTWQLGKRAQYVIGLAQTSAFPTISTGAAGTYSVTAPTYASKSVSAVVPSTASVVGVLAQASVSGVANSNIFVAPNSSYSGSEANNLKPPLIRATAGDVLAAWFLLESTNVYVVSDSVPGNVMCLGWEDNI